MEKKFDHPDYLAFRRKALLAQIKEGKKLNQQLVQELADIEKREAERAEDREREANIRDLKDKIGH